jgi:hypothetical protein
LEVLLAEPRDDEPLGVMIRAMRLFWDAGRFKEAADIARAAAPYVHPRVTGPAGARDLATLRDDELDAIDEADGRRANTQATD